MAGSALCTGATQGTSHDSHRRAAGNVHTYTQTHIVSAAAPCTHRPDGVVTQHQLLEGGVAEKGLGDRLQALRAHTVPLGHQSKHRAPWSSSRTLGWPRLARHPVPSRTQTDCGGGSSATARARCKATAPTHKIGRLDGLTIKSRWPRAHSGLDSTSPRAAAPSGPTLQYDMVSFWKGRAFWTSHCAKHTMVDEAPASPGATVVQARRSERSGATPHLPLLPHPLPSVFCWYEGRGTAP